MLFLAKTRKLLIFLLALRLVMWWNLLPLEKSYMLSLWLFYPDWLSLVKSGLRVRLWLPWYNEPVQLLFCVLSNLKILFEFIRTWLIYSSIPINPLWNLLPLLAQCRLRVIRHLCFRPFDLNLDLILVLRGVSSLYRCLQLRDNSWSMFDRSCLAFNS